MSWKKTLIGAVAALGLTLSPLSAHAAQQENDETLLQVFHLLLDGHYSHPDEKTLLQAAINGMLETLDDPFTSYMSAQEYHDFMNAINQAYAGIGVTLEVDESGSALRVASLAKDAPAEKAGLLPGDKIVEIEGSKLTKDTLQGAPAKLRGEAGTTVRIGVVRDGKPLAFTLTRENLQLPLVGSADLGDGIAYIRIYSFGDNTPSDFQLALDNALASNAKGLVLDLRGNGGGAVLAALQVADALSKQGTILIVHEDGQEIHYEADAEGSDIPLTVLIDGDTASASEMLAGALQRNGRAKLVGETSYGKGTMQQSFELSNGSELKLSIDAWELPDGTSINMLGLDPDVHIAWPEAALNAAKQLLLPSRAQTLALARKGHTGILNGSIVLTDVPLPAEKNGSLFLPLRYVFEAFGTEVLWDPETRLIHFRHNGKQVEINLQTKTMTVNGSKIPNADWTLTAGGSISLSTKAIQAITGKVPAVSADKITVYSR